MSTVSLFVYGVCPSVGGLRRCKVSSTPLPPCVESFARSLAPPFRPRSASPGSRPRRGCSLRPLNDGDLRPPRPRYRRVHGTAPRKRAQKNAPCSACCKRRKFSFRGTTLIGECPLCGACTPGPLLTGGRTPSAPTGLNMKSLSGGRSGASYRHRALPCLAPTGRSLKKPSRTFFSVTAFSCELCYSL